MRISLILIGSTASATDYVNKAVPRDRQAWFTSPAGAGKRGFPADLPQGNYAQELVVQASPTPDDPAFLRIPTQDHANHLNAVAAVSRSGADEEHRAFHCRPRPRGGRGPPRRAAVAVPSAAFPDDRLAPFPRVLPVARSDLESAGPPVGAWCALRVRSVRGSA